MQNHAIKIANNFFPFDMSFQITNNRKCTSRGVLSDIKMINSGRKEHILHMRTIKKKEKETCGRRDKNAKERKKKTSSILARESNLNAERSNSPLILLLTN